MRCGNTRHDQDTVETDIVKMLRHDTVETPKHETLWKHSGMRHVETVRNEICPII